MSSDNLVSSLSPVKIAAVVYGGGHVRSLKPVLERLNSDPSVEVHVLALTTAYEELRGTSLKLHCFQDIPVTLEIMERAVRLGAQHLHTVSEHPDVSREETCAYLGLNLIELIDKYPTETEALEAYQASGRQIFLPIDCLRKWLAAVNPRVLLTTTSPRAEKASIYAASELDIPTIVVVDLFAEGPEFEWLSDPDLGLYLCVMNAVVKDRFAHKINKKFLVDAANPAFEPPLNLTGQASKSTGKLRILWAPSPEPAIHPETGVKGDPEWPKRLGMKLITVFAPLDFAELVIRPHPNHPSMVPDNSVLDSFADIWESLARTDILITTVSTVAIQAYSLKIPIIIIRGSIVYDQTPLIDYGYATRSLSEEDLQLLGSEDYLKEIVEMQSACIDSRAGSVDKIVALVMALAEFQVSRFG